MAKNNSAAVEESGRQIAHARKMLASIQEVNRRDGVWNEHVLHSEVAAERLVEKLEKELADLKRQSGH